LFDAWNTLAPEVQRAAQRESVARGEAIFEVVCSPSTGSLASITSGP
jgi:hypothetical protein